MYLTPLHLFSCRVGTQFVRIVLDKFRETSKLMRIHSIHNIILSDTYSGAHFAEPLCGRKLSFSLVKKNHLDLYIYEMCTVVFFFFDIIIPSYDVHQRKFPSK